MQLFDPNIFSSSISQVALVGFTIEQANKVCLV